MSDEPATRRFYVLSRELTPAERAYTLRTGMLAVVSQAVVQHRFTNRATRAELAKLLVCLTALSPHNYIYSVPTDPSVREGLRRYRAPE